MINSYELRKIYIAELGVDPIFLQKLRSKSLEKAAIKDINKIKAENPNPYDAELKMVDYVKKLSENPRKRQYIGFLLEIAFFKEKILSGKTYDYLRKHMGVNEYDEATEKYVKNNWMKEYNDSPFSLLDGSNNNAHPLDNLDGTSQLAQSQPAPSFQ